jgi:hypothetical protein
MFKKKYGVVLLLVIVISSMSMGSVSADAHEYWNTCQVDQWYELDDISHSWVNTLEFILRSHHTDGPDIINEGWVEYQEGYEGGHYICKFRPLKPGKTCTWLRQGGLTTRYYNWEFTLGDMLFHMSNQHETKHMSLDKVIPLAVTAHHMDNRPFSNLNISFSVLNHSNEQVIYHENVLTDREGLAIWNFIPKQHGVYDVFAAPLNNPNYKLITAFFQVIVD